MRKGAANGLVQVAGPSVTAFPRTTTIIAELEPKGSFLPRGIKVTSDGEVAIYDIRIGRNSQTPGVGMFHHRLLDGSPIFKLDLTVRPLSIEVFNWADREVSVDVVLLMEPHESKGGHETLPFGFVRLMATGGDLLVLPGEVASLEFCTQIVGRVSKLAMLPEIAMGLGKKLKVELWSSSERCNLRPSNEFDNVFDVSGVVLQVAEKVTLRISNHTKEPISKLGFMGVMDVAL